MEALYYIVPLLVILFVALKSKKSKKSNKPTNPAEGEVRKPTPRDTFQPRQQEK